jgi:hypothetical protein
MHGHARTEEDEGIHAGDGQGQSGLERRRPHGRRRSQHEEGGDETGEEHHLGAHEEQDGETEIVEGRVPR